MHLKLKQDANEFQASLGYIARVSLNTNKKSIGEFLEMNGV